MSHFSASFFWHNARLVIGIGSGLFAGSRWALHKWQRRYGQSWPIVLGTVEWALVRTEGFRDDKAVPEVCYSYSVNGEFYSGTYSAPESDFYLFPKGSSLFIHYDPAKPLRSCLDQTEIQNKKAAANL